MKGRVLAAGEADGPALVLDEPLSLWGGMDPGSGELIDARHPQRGAMLAGRVVVMLAQPPPPGGDVRDDQLRLLRRHAFSLALPSAFVAPAALSVRVRVRP